MPYGTAVMSYDGKPFTVISVVGQRWASGTKVEDASAYYALVILPSVPTDDLESWKEQDGYRLRWIKRWNTAQDGEKKIDVAYDAIWQTITIDSRTYSLSKGNLFVIRFDERSKPLVTPLNTTINVYSTPAEHCDPMNAFKPALTEDEIAQLF